MVATLAMFPGQGSQYVGMGRAVVDQFPYTKSVYEEAEDAINFGIRALCFDGPEGDLVLTANTQPCILTTSIAIWTVLKQEAGFTPDFFAGHSLGEYSALVAAEKLPLADAVKLVRRRGEAMQRAVPEGVGAMAAVMKFSGEELAKVCAESSTGGSMVQIANYNNHQQLVIAGHREAVERAKSRLEELKARVVMLNVSAPFHSKLMAPAKEEMAPLLEAAPLAKNGHTIIANLTGKIASDYNAQHLIDQIDHPVCWTQTFETCVENSVSRYVEVGPGKVLMGLGRRQLPRGETKLLVTEDLPTTIQSL